MDNGFGLNQKQLDTLLATVSQKAGIPPEKLEQQLKSGSYDAVIGKLGKNKSEDISRVLSNPKAMEQLLSSPQAQELLRKLTGGAQGG